MRKKKYQLMTPDLTPLIDIVFLLLIFFMIVSNFNKYTSLSLELPKIGLPAMVNETKSLEIIINKNKEYLIKQGESLKIIELQSLIEKIKNEKEVIVTADKSLLYEDVMTLLGNIKANSDGVTVTLSALE
jgi:biopolymer transport protein ExbD